jgi:3-oxoacyl-[acyl-carrier protein] reductase
MLRSKQDSATEGVFQPAENKIMLASSQLDATSPDDQSLAREVRTARSNGFSKRVVLITGAAAGIGRATALRFAQNGAYIAAWDVSDKAASQLESAVKGAGGECYFQAVNVTDASAVEAAAAAVVKEWGRIDVLINNAGIVRDAQLVKWNGGSPESIMSEETWDSVVEVNMKGVFLVTRAVVPYMIKGGGGVILSAASVVGLLGNFGQTNYVASKAGVIGMTRTWARELGKHKIRVNAVAPGFIATDMVRSMPPKILEAMIARTPLGRAGTPEDVANTYFWLASDQASFIHGTVISVDGGVVIGT